MKVWAIGEGCWVGVLVSLQVVVVLGFGRGRSWQHYSKETEGQV